MNTPRTLSADYSHARAAFLRAAVEARATIATYPHELKGPGGEDLAIDVAELGPAGAKAALVVVSGTHGVEGFAGSALQLRWLQEAVADSADDVRIIFVHAFNPHGFAWVRRVNEDNVDLNRNFIDWDEPPPPNPDYMEIADVIVPASWTDSEQERTLARLVEYLAEHGMEKLQAVISGGQYSDSNGVFYGGAGPVWSHLWLRRWVSEALLGIDKVAILDLHTGLGDWGTAQLIGAHEADSEPHRRASEWFGNVVPMGGADSVSAFLLGDWLRAITEIASPAEVTGVAIEYGTVDTISVMQALRADAWLHAYGDPTGPDAPAIKAQVRAAFADDDPAWLEALWAPFASSVSKALIKLSS